MTDTLSSRLLEVIAEREARINAWGHWQVGDSFYHCCAALRTAGDAGDLDYGDCDCGLQARRDEALGFCTAHRKIVNRCRAILGIEGWENGDAHAMARQMLEFLAEGYAIEATDG